MIRRVCRSQTKEGLLRRGDSPHNLDLQVDAFFKQIGVSSGLYIECGAADGISQSNTLLLEQRGWRGILIEANSALIGMIEQTRPNNIIYNAALVGPDYEFSTIKGNFSKHANMTVKETSEFTKDFSNKEFNDFLVNGYHSMLTGYICTDHPTMGEVMSHPSVGPARRAVSVDSWRSIVEVPARTLFSILQEYQIKPHAIDFFSLDIEGYELKALDGLNLDYYRPKYILVETQGPEEKHKIDNFMLEKKYKEVANSHDHDIMYEAQ